MTSPAGHSFLSSPPAINKQLPSLPSSPDLASSKKSLPSVVRKASSSRSTSGKSETSSEITAKADTGASTPVSGDGERVRDKVKGLFAKFGDSRKRSNSASSQPSTGAPSVIGAEEGQKPTSTPPNGLTQPPSLLSLDSQGMLWDKSDEFRQAVTRAEAAVDKLGSTQTMLMGVASLAQLGAGWIPGVGKGVDLIVQMLGQAQKISMGRVAALRLVERSANVLQAVQQSVIDSDGKVGSVMENNINNLFSNLRDSAYLMTKQSSRPFLKLYLHADDTQRKIDKATEDLEDFIRIFQLQAQISAAAWQEESRADHQKDLEILLEKQVEARKDDQALLRLLEVKADQQQEAIKTLQRTLEALIASQSRAAQIDLTTSRPDSPADLDSPIFHPMPTSVEPRMRLQLDSSELSASRDSLHLRRPEVRRTTVANIAVIQDHREFCERALDVLRRHSSASDIGVPDWTITSLEVQHGDRISSGFFSEVHRGQWQDQEVAIKELNSNADRTLFINEVDVWRQLRSPYILPFFGASSTTGPPPWFLISPYMKNKDVLTFLRNEAGKHANKIALLHQTAQGMEYLHRREILHGDLKAANVLISDIGSAVICDFGLSHLKLDLVTKSHHDQAVSHALGGTMRWQSPERLGGAELTYQTDVYAFGMTIYEVMTLQVPFGYVDDYALRKSIQDGERPKRPSGISDTLWSLMKRCWDQDPKKRPRFDEICETLSHLYKAPKTNDRQYTDITNSSSTSNTGSYGTADEGQMPEEQEALSPQSDTVPLPLIDDEEGSSTSGSIHSIPPHLENQLSFESDRSEKHYRHYLQHGFDDRLTVPLWFPSAVPLGSIGYIRHGQFVRIIDGHRPPLDKTSLPPMPFLDEFSTLQTKTFPVNVRSATERGLDYVTSLTNFIKPTGESSKQSVSRRISFPLKPGMKQASLIVDDGEFEIYQSFDEARAFLVANIDWILTHYGDTHHICKEDVMIIVGSLKARNYAMIVSNFAPRTTLTFNVHASPTPAKPWGTWTVNRQPDQPPNRGSSSSKAKPEIGPRTDDTQFRYTAKVSKVYGSPRDAVLLAKLKFPPGGRHPALYP